MEELEFKEGFAKILKLERNKLGLTQEQMAEIVLVDYKTYQSWELMSRSIKLHSLKNMIEALSDRPDDPKKYSSIIKALKEYIF